MTIVGNFKPSIMARLTHYSGPITSFRGKPERVEKALHFKGTLAEAFALRAAMKEEGNRSWQAVESRKIGQDEWAGCRMERVSAMLAAQRSADAQKALTDAVARLDVKGAPSVPEYRITGGVWSVPRYLTGHPLCAIRRPRTALPPKNLNIAASYSSYVESADAAFALAKLARAAWEYTRQGGAVTMTVHYYGDFREPAPDGSTGFLMSIKVPLTDIAALATAVSIQAFRVLFSDCASALSGQLGDSIPIRRYSAPGVITLKGDRLDDAKALAAASIK